MEKTMLNEMTNDEILEVEGGSLVLWGVLQAVKIVAPVIATTFAIHKVQETLK